MEKFESHIPPADDESGLPTFEPIDVAGIVSHMTSDELTESGISTSLLDDALRDNARSLGQSVGGLPASYRAQDRRRAERERYGF